MLSPPRRWIREQPLSSITSCVRRALCSRRHTLWILLVLVLVCIGFQTFVARQARSDKVTRDPHLSFTVNKSPPFSSLEQIFGNLWSNSGLTMKPGLRSLHNSQNQKEDFAKSSKNISKVTKSRHNQTSKISTLFSKTLPRNCKTKTHIVFLKTHKTASSTILNILYRFGESRNLTFALPLNKHSQLFYPFFFAPHFVEGVTSGRMGEFHIMCNHMRFKKSEVGLNQD